MKRARRIAIVAFGVVLGLWGLGSLPLPLGGPGAVRPARAVHLTGPLSVGVAETDLTPDRKVPLGGFGSRHGAKFTTVRDRVHARAMVFVAGGRRVGIVSLDVVLVPPPLVRAITRRARRDGFDSVVVAATHTHNGPGGLWDDTLAELIGLGRYDAAYTHLVRDRAVDALEQALAAAVPARLRVGTGAGPSVCRSRDPGRTPDRRLTVIEADPLAGGKVLGRLVVFACHATVLGAHDHRLSAGWPGVLARHLDGTTVFLQGAVGDVTSAPIPGATTKDARMVALGEVVAKAVRALPLAGTGTAPVRLGTTPVDLPAPTGETIAPLGLRTLTGNLLYAFAPRRSRVAALTVGTVTLAMVPGEPVSPLAARWTRRLGARFHQTVRIVGLAGGYLGYLETARALAARGGESRQAYYGPRAVALVYDGLAHAIAGR